MNVFRMECYYKCKQ